MADKRRTHLGDVIWNPSRRLNAKKKREKHVAFAEKRMKELQRWVERRGV